MRSRRMLDRSFETLERRVLLASIQWVGGNGDWDTAANWDLNRIPNSGDQVSIPTGAVVNVNTAGRQAQTINSTGTLKVNSSGALFVSNGGSLGEVEILGGSLDLGYAGYTKSIANLTWTGGTFAGLGATNLNSGTFSTNATKTLRTSLNVTGNVTHSGSGTLHMPDGNSDLLISTGGVYDLTGDADITAAGFGTYFQIQGTLRKSGAGESLFDSTTAEFEILGGTIDAQAGTFRIPTLRGISRGGAINAAAGATVRIEGANNYWGGKFTGTGAGRVEFASGILYSFYETNGLELDFAPGLFHFTGGVLQSSNASYPLTLSGTIQVSGDATKSFTGTPVLKGKLVLSGTGQLSVHNAALNIESTGTLELTDGATVYSGTITNRGTIRKLAGAGTATFTNNSAIHHINGTVDVVEGRLNTLGPGNSENTTFKVAAGAVLDLTESGLLTWKGTMTGTGGGQVLLDSGGIEGSGDLDLDFAEGMFQFGAAYLGGGSTRVRNIGFLQISGTGDRTTRAAIENAGTVRQNFTGAMGHYGFGSFKNLAGAVWEIAGTGTIDNSTFENLGTIRKTGTGASTIKGEVTNRPGAKIEVTSGTLILDRGSHLYPGSFDVTAGGVLQFSGPFFHRFYDGTFTNNGTGIVRMAGPIYSTGTDIPIFNFQGNTLQLDNGAGFNGAFTFAGETHLVATTGAYFRSDGTTAFRNTGTWVHSGSGVLGIYVTTSLSNEGTYNITGDGDFQIYGVNVGSVQAGIINSGTFRKSGGTGLSELFDPNNLAVARFSNLGTVEALSGTLKLGERIEQFTRQGSGGAARNVLTGGKWRVGEFSTLEMPGGTNIPVSTSPLPPIQTNAAEVTLSGQSSAFSQIENVSTNTGTLSITNGRQFFTTGAITNSGILRAANGGTLSVNGTLGNTGTLAFGIEGTSSSGKFGRINSTGAAALGGEARIEVGAGFAPAANDTYTLMSFPSKTGDFGSVTGLDPYFTNGAITNAVSFQITSGDTAPVPDLSPVASSISVSAMGLLGSPISISYRVNNLSVDTANGNWRDSIYLSSNGTFDPSDTLLGRVNRTGPVDGNSFYDATLSDAAIPSLAAGNYYVIVVADSNLQLAETERGNNTAVSSSTIEVSVNTIELDTPKTGTIATGQDVFYRLVVPQGGGDIRLSSDFAETLQAEVFVRFGAPPTRSVFDFASSDLMQLSRQFTLPNAKAGDWYILLHGRENAGAGKSFTLSATRIAFDLASVSPAKGSNKGQATTLITGAGFTPSTAVELLDGSGNVVRNANVTFIDANHLHATFDLTGVAAGDYGVRASKSGASDSIASAYQVVVGETGRLRVDIITPGAVRAGRQYVVYVDYQNAGDTDIIPPILVVRANGGAFSLEASASPTLTETRFLAVSPAGKAGVLAPGQKVRVPIYVLGGDITFEALSLSPNATDAMDWEELRAEIKPDDALAGWDAVFDAKFKSAGNSVGDYVRLIASAATLYQLREGETTSDIGDLHGILLSEGFAEREANVSGKIYFGSTSQPAENVVVTATHRGTGEKYATGSLADGTVRLRGLPAGTYDVTFEHAVNPATPPSFVVSADGTAPEQSWAVERGGSISGRLGLPSGVLFYDPVTGLAATVVATDESGKDFTAEPDQFGNYEFDHLAPGKYRLEFSTAATLPVVVNDVEVLENGETANVNLFSGPGATIKGTVRDADTNAAKPDVTVGIFSDPGNPRIAITDSNGRYTIAGVSPGSISVVVVNENLVAAPVNAVAVVTQTTENVDLLADANALGKVSGVATLDGTAVKGAAITLLQNDVQVGGTVTDSQGKYTLENLAPSNYIVRIEGATFATQELPFTASAGATTTADFTLTYSARAVGTVTFTTSAGSAPAAGLRVSLLGPDGTVTATTTDAAGKFIAPQLDPGEYQVMLSDGSHRRSFTIDADDRGEVDVSFQISAGVILGRLMNPGSGTQGLAGAVAALVLNDQVVNTAATNENGYFSLPYTAPGTYRVVFYSEIDQHFAPVDNVVVAAGGITDLGTIQASSATVALRLTDASTGNDIAFTPEADGAVFLTQLDSPLAPTKSISLSFDATADLTGLTSGRYLVEVGVPGFAYTQTIATFNAGSNALTIPLGVGGQVSGSVQGPGNATIAGISVIAVRNDAPEIVYRTVSEADGSYILGLPAGEYTLVATDLRENPATRLAPAFLGTVNVSNGSASTKNALLDAGTSTLTGSINPAAAQGAANSAPLWAMVVLKTLSGVEIATVEADRFGNFVFPSLTPGDYLLTAEAGGFAFTETAITVSAGGNAGFDLNGSWAAPGTSPGLEDETTPPGASAKGGPQNAGGDDSLSLSSIAYTLMPQRLREIWEVTFSEPKKLPGFYGNSANIPAHCELARQQFMKVLRLQIAAENFYQGWYERWDGANDVFWANVGLFGVAVGKFAASLYQAKNISAYSSKLDGLLYSQKIVREGFNNAFVKNAGTLAGLKKVGEDLGTIVKIENDLKKLVLTTQQVFELRSISAPALAGLPSAIATNYLNFGTDTFGGFTTLQNMVDALMNCDKWTSFADVSAFVSTVAGFGSTIATILDFTTSIINIVKPNPAFAPVFALLAPISEGLNTIYTAAGGVKDLLNDATAVNQAKERYYQAVRERDAAFQAFLDLLELCEEDDNDKTGKPNKPLTREQLAALFIVRSTDPNDIIGPAGAGSQRAMRPDQNFPYTILFENIPTATAPAQVVTITHQLDADADWSTFELGSFGFDTHRFDVPAGLNFYETRIDFTTTRGWVLDFTAKLDLTTGIATWSFETIDPETGDLIADALDGFLPPNVTGPEGEGFVEFFVSPKSDAATGTKLDAQASIVFDDNAPLETPVWSNLIDASAPTSSINPLPANSNNGFSLTWAGDDGSGSGIAHYDIYVSKDGGGYTLLLDNTTQTSTTFSGQIGSTYSFYAVATDLVGFRQLEPTAPQASTTLVVPTTGGNRAPTASLKSPTAGARGQSLSFKLTATDPDSGDNSAGFTYKINFGDGTTKTISPKANNGSGVTLDYTFKNKGTYKVTLTAMDRKGKVSSVVTRTISIAAVAMLADPTDSSRQALFVGGTTGKDTIRFDKASAGKIKLTINGVDQGLFSPSGRIFAFGQAGDDLILIAPDVPTNVIFFGNDGNDILHGGSGINALLGGAGKDSIYGHGGRDIVIGGSGKDLIKGDGSGDIFIGGTTSYDGGNVGHLASLSDLLAAWNTGESYEKRVAKIRAGVGASKALFSTTTVKDDNAKDDLHGGTGLDWFFARTSGSNKDQVHSASGEVVTKV